MNGRATLVCAAAAAVGLAPPLHADEPPMAPAELAAALADLSTLLAAAEAGAQCVPTDDGLAAAGALDPLLRAERRLARLQLRLGAPAGGPSGPLGRDEYAHLLRSLAVTPFTTARLATLGRVAQRRWLTAAQISGLMDLAPLSDDKLRVLAVVAGRLIDPENGAAVLAQLPSAVRDQARALLESGGAGVRLVQP